MQLTVDYTNVSTAPKEIGLSSAGAPLCSIPEKLEGTVLTHKVLRQSDVRVLQAEEVQIRNDSHAWKAVNYRYLTLSSAMLVECHHHIDIHVASVLELSDILYTSRCTKFGVKYQA